MSFLYRIKLENLHLSVKLITDDTLRLNELLHEMDKIPGISSTRTIIVLKTEKETNVITLG